MSARSAGCEREPLVPTATIAEFPVEVFGAAEKRTGVLELPATVKGLAGFEMTPAGIPVSVTWTEPVKPLSGLTDNFTAELVAPCWRFKEFVENPMEKSGCAGGGGGSV